MRRPCIEGGVPVSHLGSAGWGTPPQTPTPVNRRGAPGSAGQWPHDMKLSAIPSVLLSDKALEKQVLQGLEDAEDQFEVTAEGKTTRVEADVAEPDEYVPQVTTATQIISLFHYLKAVNKEYAFAFLGRMYSISKGLPVFPSPGSMHPNMNRGWHPL